MLSLSGDQIDSAYEQVFGHNFSCYEPQPPPKPAQRATARPPQAPCRPPRPPGRNAPRPQRPPSSSKAPVNTAAPSSRRTQRKRIVFSDRKATVSPSDAQNYASQPTAAAAAPHESIRDKADGAAEAENSISTLSDLSDSSPLPSGIQRGSSGSAAAPRGDFLHTVEVPRMDLYYGKPSLPSAKTPSISESSLPHSLSKPPPPPPPPPPPVEASEPPYKRPSSAPAKAKTHPTGRARPQTPPARPNDPSPTQAMTVTSALRSEPASVFDRLAGDISCGTTTLGKRVLQWAKGAGLALQPPPGPWRALHLYAAAPQQHERLWRQACAKARHRLSRFAQGRLGLSAAGPTSPSAAGSREHSVAQSRRHADPHQIVTGQSGRGNMHGGSSSNPLSAPGGLRAYRCREEYKRWCLWQLNHFYELGSKYLTSVWRMSPLLGRRYQRSRAGAATGSSDVSATGVLSGIFDGRYTVPSAASITETLAACKEQDRRAKVLLRLLMHENTSSSHATEKNTIRRGGSRNGNAGDGSDTSGSDSEGSDAGEEEKERDGQDDVYRSVNESRRSSEAVSSTEPYVDVRLDEATGLLHLSLYVNGDEGGNGADYVGSSVAACVDNNRWLILKGLWSREVLIFHFHRPSLFDDDDDDGGRDGKTMNSGASYNEAEEQKISRRSQLVEGLVVKGIAFVKTPLEHASATAQDSFVCSRCGRVRRQHNDAYISKFTGRLVRGYYYCVLCQRRTHHVHLPPTDQLAGHVEEVLRASVERQGRGKAGALITPAGTPMSTRATTSPASTAMLFRSVGLLPSPASTGGRSQLPVPQPPLLSGDVALAAKAMQEWTRASAAAPRPAWQATQNVRSDEIFGRLRGLSCPPPHPHY